MSNLPVVFFDLGNTLIKPKDAVLVRSVERIDKEALNLRLRTDIREGVLRFKDAEKAQWKATPAKDINPVKTGEEELRFWILFYIRVLKRMSFFSPSQELLHFLAHIAMDPTSFELFDDVYETLDLLKQNGISMGILSNAFPSASLIIDYLDLRKWFQFVILSYEHNIMPKPHPQIYEFAIQQANLGEVNTHKVLFVDDRDHFVEGAIKANISGVLIDRELSAIESECNKVTDLRQISKYVKGSATSPLLWSSCYA